MKKGLTLTIILALCLALCFSFAGCGGKENTDTGTNTDSSTETSTNTGTSTKTETSTDTNTGTETSTDTDSDTSIGTESTNTDTNTDVPVHKHTEEIIPAVAPTCTKSGLTEGKRCSECGEILVEQTTVDALGHDYIVNEAKEPTCTEIGWNEYQTCSRCDYTTYEVLAANGHSYDGGYVCTICGNETSPSEGLEFKLSDDGTYAIVVGIGDCWDKAIYIPSEYRGFPVREISSDAFKGKTYITEIFIPSSATTVASESFSGCTALEAVTISKNITVIADKTFYNCSALNNVEFPTGITSIGNSAFEGCTSLTSVTIGESVASIGKSAFSSCTALEKIDFNATTINDLSENNHVFYNAGTSNDGIKVTIGKNVTGIPAYLFYETPYVTCVVFEDGSVCESIGDYAFSVCDFTNIEIPSSIKSIGNYAFYCCADLASIIIPNTTSIGSCAFLDCKNLAKVNYLGNIIEWCNIAFDAPSTNPLHNGAILQLNGESLTEFIIPDTITEINDFSFIGCTSLESITVHENVTSIGEYAFHTCINLNEISFNATALDDLSTNNFVFFNAGKNGLGINVTISKNVTKIPAYLFYPNDTSYGSPKITSIVFEEDSACESIGEYAFYCCADLTSITIPNSVTNIGDSSLSFCSSLKTIVIGDGVSTLPIGLLSGCSSLENLTLPFVGISKTEKLPYSKTLFGYIFGSDAYPGGTKTIQGYKRNSDSSTGLLNTITYYIPSTLTDVTVTGGYVLSYAFDHCTNLKNVTIDANSIGEDAFRRCDELTSITIGENVYGIGERAFSGCHYIEEINFNARSMGNLNEINYVFSHTGQDGDGITVTIGKNVTKIPAYLFCPWRLNEGMTPKITKIVFEEGSVCESIGEYAFYYSKWLTSITISNSLTSIGSYAFYYCRSSIKDIYINDIESWCNISFGNEDANPLSYGRKHNLYINGELVTNLIIPETVTEIRDYAFRSCDSIVSIVIPNSVTSIGKGAFIGCSFASVTIPDSVTYIGNSAFNNCTSLEYNEYDNAYYLGNEENPYIVLIKAKDTSITSCTINENTKFIHSDAFSDCYSLASVTIPDSVTSIGSSAFYYCTSLTNIIIPDSVTSIGNYAFYECDSLTSITIPDSVTSIGNYAFQYCSSLTIYCEATEQPSGWASKWNVSNLPVYWYSESEPTDEGNYWHYVDGVITIWE